MTSTNVSGSSSGNQPGNNPRVNLEYRDGLIEQRTYWLGLSYFARFSEVSLAFYSIWLSGKVVKSLVQEHIVDAGGSRNYKFLTVTNANVDKMLYNVFFCLGSSLFLNVLDGFFTRSYDRKRKQIKHLH